MNTLKEFFWILGLIPITMIVSFLFFKKKNMITCTRLVYYSIRVYVAVSLLGFIVWIYFRDEFIGEMGKLVFFSGMLCSSIPVYFNAWIKENILNNRVR